MAVQAIEKGSMEFVNDPSSMWVPFMTLTSAMSMSPTSWTRLTATRVNLEPGYRRF
jgi:hypothetical protein